MPKTSLLELNRIIQGAALAKSTEEHVQLIVDAVSDVIATDVCSLYRQTAEKDMELVVFTHKNSPASKTFTERLSPGYQWRTRYRHWQSQCTASGWA
mgnify:CR=1 FL=1